MHGSLEQLERDLAAGVKVDVNALCGAVGERFISFRRVIRPDMLWGWWTEEVARHLQRFWREFALGMRPKLAIGAPPQHGKSWSVTDFIAWVAGRDPDKKVIFASYSDELGVRTNLDLQRILSSERYRAIFPGTQISETNVVTMADRWKRNSSHIEYVGHGGSFRNTTVSGQINGMELHLGVIDDPVKGRAEAYSKVVRDRTWEWFADDFCSRFAADGAMLVVMTRWHKDDLLGRFVDRFPQVRVLDYPAIAEHDERHRRVGDPLFPELKPLEFLNERRRMLTEASWESIYQQHPITVGGGLFPVDKLRVVPMFEQHKVIHSVRYWDKAGTEGGEGAYTSGVLMHAMADGTFVVGDVERGRWSALQREERIEAVSRADAKAWPSYEVGVEQEPGSGGKESAEATIRRLAGLRVYADRPTGKKELRAEPYAAQVQGGNVAMKAGGWCADYVEELESFPAGRFKDQVDASSGAFAKLSARNAYDTSYSWL